MNFQDLLAKMKSIDENTDVQTQECGEMPVMVGHQHGGMEQPAQQDTVNMNLSMNAQGSGGIRDLMSILKNIEQGGGDDAFAGALEADNDGSAGEELASIDSKDLALDVQPDGDQMLGDKGMEEVTGEIANNPDPEYQSQDYMHNTLSVNKQDQHKHGYRNADNPLGFKEGLEARLANLYQEIKESSENVPAMPVRTNSSNNAMRDAWIAKHGKTHNTIGTPKKPGMTPSDDQSAAEIGRLSDVAGMNAAGKRVPPIPVTKNTSNYAMRDAWIAKYGKTHNADGTPKS